MFRDGGSTAADRHRWLDIRATELLDAASSAAGGTAVSSTSAAGSSVTFRDTVSLGDEARAGLAVIDQLRTYADFTDVASAIASIRGSVSRVCADFSATPRL